MSQAAADRYAWIEPGVEDLGAGVHRIPLPLPLDGLKAVNVYAITDPSGVDLIDAGFAIVALFLAVWVAALAYWRFGQVEARWTIPIRDGHLVSETLEE